MTSSNLITVVETRFKLTEPELWAAMRNVTFQGDKMQWVNRRFQTASSGSNFDAVFRTIIKMAQYYEQ